MRPTFMEIQHTIPTHASFLLDKGVDDIITFYCTNFYVDVCGAYSTVDATTGIRTHVRTCTVPGTYSTGEYKRHRPGVPPDYIQDLDRS